VDPADHRLAVSQRDGNAVVVTWAQNTRRQATRESSSIVFQKYGDTYFLRQVWDGGASHGHELAPSKTERQMAKATGPGVVASLRVGSK
jgi:hypothetical protein